MPDIARLNANGVIIAIETVSEPDHRDDPVARTVALPAGHDMAGRLGGYRYDFIAGCFLPVSTVGFQAVASWHYGATAPDPTYPLMLWGDQSTGKVWLRDAANTAWAEIGLLGPPFTWTAIGGLAGVAVTGDVKATFRGVADDGWVMMDDGSIGPAGSGATTRANADCEDLFALLWGNVANTHAPLQDSTGSPIGRGASAAADWAASRRLVLPKVLGRALAGAGWGVDLSDRALGETAGAETHTLTTKADGTADALFSLEATAPAMPSGYGYERRIGWVLTDGSGSILAFRQAGDRFWWLAPRQVATGVTLSATAGLLTLSVPPGAVARISALISHASAVRYVLFSCPDDPDLAASATVHNARCLSNGGAQTTVLEVPADASGRIRHRADAASATLAELMTLGWIDGGGSDLAAIEAELGLPAGQGQQAFDLINGARTALDDARIVALREIDQG